MTSNTEETFFITHDTYVSSDAPYKNEDGFPLLNVGRSEKGSLNRVLLNADFGDMTGKQVLEAKLCLFQIYTGIHAKESDIFYLHEVTTEWGEETATWKGLGSTPTGNLVSSATFSTQDDIKVCFEFKDPSRISNNRFGYILKGDEDLDKHDRWFRASEYISDSKEVYSEAQSDLYHPHFVLKTAIDPNKVTGSNNPDHWAGSFGRSSIAFIVGITMGSLALVFVALMAVVAIRRRRNRYAEEEESSVESEEVEKDFVDNLGAVFGVVSSSDDEDETLNTRETTVYSGHDGIEVQQYRPSVSERFQNLFGVPEEETTITDDSTYISRWYRNNRY